MTARKLDWTELSSRCDPATLALDTAAMAPPEAAAPMVGQARARAAAEFAIAMPHDGYHLFVSGAAGVGKRTLAREAIAARVSNDGVKRRDWVYVNNFELAHQPLALDLPAGRGAQLRTDLRASIAELRSTLPAMFESEEFATDVERINAEYKERAEHALEEVGRAAQQRGLAMIRTPVGFTFAPQKDGEVMASEAFEALPDEQRVALQAAVAELQDQLLKALRASMRLHKERADRVHAASRSMTLVVVEHAMGELLPRYADLPRVRTWLEAVRDEVVEHADDFRARSGEDGVELRFEQGDALGRFEVNLLVDAGGGDGAPIVEADLPSYQNLIGRVDHLARLGTLVTDFRLIKPGLLHRANGGYLLIDALKLLLQPFAWDALKRALTRREIRIEPLSDMFSIISTVRLEPEPIPLQVKVVLVGEREICALLQAHDPEFGRLFRVQADLGDDLPREPATERELAHTLAARMAADRLLPPDAPALAAVIDHGARLAGDATRVTAEVQRLIDLLLEADHHARRASRAQISAADVASAIAARRERAARIDERHRDAMLRDILLIASSGQRVGQINALTVYEAGDEWFGAPARISATSRLGDGQVIDVQRETHLGGPLHAKGVLILSSFLAARYSRLRPYSIVASLVFEQTYGLVEGDSASLAELCALLSSVADVPLRQNLAVTGSVNQFGDVQAIGAVNHKIEGFFDLCAARGLDGTHGVVIPQANAAHLMLRDDVIDAVRNGRFDLHTVDTIDDAMTLLTGLPAGDPSQPGDETFNGRIARRLADYSAMRTEAPRSPRRSRKPSRHVIVREGKA